MKQQTRLVILLLAVATLGCNGLTISISTLQATATPSAPVATSAPCPAGMVSQWPAEGNAQDAVDGNEGSLYNGTSFVSGRTGRAFSFDGVDDRINIPDAENMQLTSLSIVGWVYVLSFPSIHGQILFRGDDRAALDPYYLSTQPNGQLRFHVESQSAIENLEAPLNANRWVHMAATLDNSTGKMRIYLDGQVNAEAQTTVRPFRNLDPASNPGIGIGNHGGYPRSPHNQPFHGYIDELALYSRALSASEVVSIFAGACSRQ